MNIYNWLQPLFNLFIIFLKKENELNQTNGTIVNQTLSYSLKSGLSSTVWGTTKPRELKTLSPTKVSTKNISNEVSTLKINRSLLENIIGCSLFSVLAFTGIFGNSLVIFAIFTDSAVKTSTQLANLGVLNLAFTDLMTTSIVCLPGAISYLFDEYVLGNFFCGVWSVFNLMGLVATMQLLAVISGDRYIAVGWSLHYPQYVTYNRFLASIGYVWFTSFFGILAWTLFLFEYDQNAGTCDFAYAKLGPAVPAAMYYGMVCTVVYLVIPTAIISYSNVSIIKMSQVKGPKKDDEETTKANARVLKAMVIVIVSYYVLTFPVACIRAIKVIGGAKVAKHIPDIFTFISSVLQFSASIVNPLIYGLFRKDFREAYGRIWKKVTFRN